MASGNNLVRVLLITCLLVFFAMISWLSLARYRSYNVAMLDLGNMSQAIWSATQGKALIYTGLEGQISRLGWNVELIYVPISLLYALFPDPKTLLVLQTGLYVLGALPAFWLARRHLESEWAGLLAALVYLAYPVALTTVLFDFHGDTLAMPLLLFAVNALDKRSRWGSVVWIVLALSCKIYVALPVTLLGIAVWLKGERKIGLTIGILGVCWGAFFFFFFKPLFSADSSANLTAIAPDYLAYYFGGQGNILNAVLARIPHALVVFGPALLLGLRVPLWFGAAALVALPALISEGPGPGYDYRYHHYALVVPFLIAAVVYGAEVFKQRAAKQTRKGGRTWLGDLVMTLILTLILTGVLVNTPLNVRFLSAPKANRLEEAGYAISARDALKDRWLQTYVPTGAPIAATTFLTPHIINRELLYSTRIDRKSMAAVLGEVEYAVVDAFGEYAGGGVMYLEQSTLALLLQNPDFYLLQMQDGLYLFGREVDKGELLRYVNRIAKVEDSGAGAEVSVKFGDAIGLQDVKAEQVAAGHFRLTYRWVALEDLDNLPALFAVTRIAGVPESRYLHLPSWVLAPTTEWQRGDMFLETFEILLPADLEPGEYTLVVGWYDSSLPTAALTTDKSRVGEEFDAAQIEVR
jgi:uncharacterized membrane protein